jgi:soluble lytic murein transglycosylase-like protein
MAAASTPATSSTTLARIAQCESGGNPAAVSASGTYRGKYQFTYATWRALGGTGDPAKAPEAVQDAMAAKLLALRGTAPWPACG